MIGDFWNTYTDSLKPERCCVSDNLDNDFNDTAKSGCCLKKKQQLNSTNNPLFL